MLKDTKILKWTILFLITSTCSSCVSNKRITDVENSAQQALIESKIAREQSAEAAEAAQLSSEIADRIFKQLQKK